MGDKKKAKASKEGQGKMAEWCERSSAAGLPSPWKDEIIGYDGRSEHLFEEEVRRPTTEHTCQDETQQGAL